MVKLTQEMKDDLKKIKLIPLATAGPNGEPNVVPMGMYVLRDDETLWIIDNFMQKSLENIKKNPRVAFYIWSLDTASAYQVKGNIESIVTDGPLLAEAKVIADGMRPGLPTKGLLIMKITDVYSVAPGPMAGKKLL